MTARPPLERLCRLGTSLPSPRPESQPAGERPPSAKPELSHMVRMVRERILREHADLLRAGPGGAAMAPDRERVRTAVRRVLAEAGLASRPLGGDAVVDAVIAEVFGYGPLEGPLQDDAVTEVMVNGPERIVVERGGALQDTGLRFQDEEHLQRVILRMLAPLGRRLDHQSPFVEARLPDGSRLHAIIPPLAVHGTALTIRKFRRDVMTLTRLEQAGACAAAEAAFLRAAIRARFNIVVCGPTSSGKTTLLNALIAEIPASERLVTIEDAAELQPVHPHVVALEARPPGPEGTGAVSVRDLVRNALRMRPDRLIIGEVRGREAFDLLNALHTGHDGSLSTVHANGPVDALHRLENMCLMAGEGLPHAAARAQVRAGVDLVVHLERWCGGERRVARMALVDKRPGPEHRVLSLRVAPGAAAAWPGWCLERFRRAGIEPPGGAATPEEPA